MQRILTALCVKFLILFFNITISLVFCLLCTRVFLFYTVFLLQRVILIFQEGNKLLFQSASALVPGHQISWVIE